MNSQFLDFKIIDRTDTQTILSQCEGTIQKGVFICFSEEEKELEDFLVKILTAVKLDYPNDVLVLRKTKDTNFSFGALLSHYPIQKALFFGIEPSTLGIQVNHQNYQPFTINNCTYLISDKLETLKVNKELKVLLWNALKVLFL